MTRVTAENEEEKKNPLYSRQSRTLQISLISFFQEDKNLSSSGIQLLKDVKEAVMHQIQRAVLARTPSFIKLKTLK